ncbi:MAG: DUF2155 domain-containing protein [Nitrospirota bacterium]|nr:DUF2155 domain-containing protein [Nitrospirota bacterium]
MIRRVSLRVTLSALIVTLAAGLMAGCGKKEEPKQPAAPPAAQAPMPMDGTHLSVPPKQEQQLVVPDAVRGKWSGAKLVVEDREKKAAKEFEVKLNADFQIPGSNLVVKVGDFLPNFVMNGPVLTSLDNQTGNPALKVTIVEGDKELFSGWLFSKYPQIHPFEHPKFGVTLKEGVPGKG